MDIPLPTPAELTQLREDSARLAAIRSHVEPKFWSSRYGRNDLLDDVRALAAGLPMTSKGGRDYFTPTVSEMDAEDAD